MRTEIDEISRSFADINRDLLLLETDADEVARLAIQDFRSDIHDVEISTFHELVKVFEEKEKPK